VSLTLIRPSLLNKCAKLLKIITELAKIQVSSSSSDINSDILIYQNKVNKQPTDLAKMTLDGV